MITTERGRSMELTEDILLPTTRDTLLTAIEVLHYHGWCKLEYITKYGPLCVAGAIWRAARNDSKVAYFAMSAVRDIVGEAPELWNDDPDTTFENVIMVLNKAVSNTTPKEEINGLI